MESANRRMGVRVPSHRAEPGGGSISSGPSPPHTARPQLRAPRGSRADTGQVGAEGELKGPSHTKSCFCVLCGVCSKYHVCWAWRQERGRSAWIHVDMTTRRPGLHTWTQAEDVAHFSSHSHTHTDTLIGSSSHFMT